MLLAMLRKGPQGVWSFMKKRENGGGMFIKNRNVVFIFLRNSIIKVNESG